jgi:hypothetical protein
MATAGIPGPTLAVCCVCKHVADDADLVSPWGSMSAYLDRHHLQQMDVRLSHTYCPACYEAQARAWFLPPRHSSRRSDRPRH